MLPPRNEATAASKALAQKLMADPKLFPAVQELSESAFFRSRNGLLFLPADEVAARRYLVAGPAAPPGAGCRAVVARLVQALALSLNGIPAQKFHHCHHTGAAPHHVSPSRSRTFCRPAGELSWRELVNRKAPTPADLRRSSR